MDLTQNTDPEWEAIARHLPDDRDRSARQLGAFTRPREVKTSDRLLRPLFFYAWSDLSLRGTAAAANEVGIACLSDVALLKRFKKTVDWLRPLIDQALPCLQNSRGTDYRLHACYASAEQRFHALELTDARGGETFQRHPAREGDLWIASLRERGAQAIVRHAWNHLPLQTPHGRSFDLIEALKTLPAEHYGDRPVQTVPDPGRGIPAVSGRIAAAARSAPKARDEVTRNAKKKQRQVLPETLIACDYFFVFTTLPVHEADAELVLALYRFRRQVECAFKQFKSQLHPDRIKAYDPDLVQAFLLAKLLGVLLLEDLSCCWVSSPPRTSRQRTRSASGVCGRRRGGS